MKGIKTFFKGVVSWTRKHKTLFALIIALIFAGTQIPVILNHEDWLDEGVTWELSKDINISNIYEVNSAEPHPLLWQVILAPFSQNGFPIITENFIALFFVTLAIFLFFRFAPMGFGVKIIFALSNAFCYYNPVIARYYSLAPLMIVLVCMAYKNRHEKPLLYGLSLAGLMQVHFLMYGFVLALAIGYFFEEVFSKEKAKQTIKTIAKFALPMIISLALVLPCIFLSTQNQAHLNGSAQELTNASGETLTGKSIAAFLGYNSVLVTIVVSAVLILLVICIASASIKKALYLIAGVMSWWAIMNHVYLGYSILEQKITLITLFVIAITWMLYLEEKTKKENIISRILGYSEIVKYLRKTVKAPAVVMALLFCITSIPKTMADIKLDLKNNFSASKIAANYLDNMEPDSLVILMDSSAVNTFNAPARAYTKNKDLKYYNYLIDGFNDRDYLLKYTEQNIKLARNSVDITDKELIDMISKFSNEFDHIYYVRQKPYCGGAEPFNNDVLKQYEQIALLHDGEFYMAQLFTPVYLYKIK